MMSNLLRKKAVDALEGEEVREILAEFLNTGPEMVQSHATPAAPAQQTPGGISNPR